MKTLVVVALVVLVLYMASGSPSPTSAPPVTLPPDNSIPAIGSTPAISPAMAGGQGLSGQNQLVLNTNSQFVGQRWPGQPISLPVRINKTESGAPVIPLSARPPANRPGLNQAFVTKL